ncbi:hypothetical protein H7J86_21405 [Mycobacterium hackensackense]|uniref:hypothetical protein n=1 Tax=Mycobacterium hackensackense TaxID=228909 RepID=UPI00226598DB|nr:hypothetical protein [Mycobacterium hackensackense]MCV7254722.1 hypothetical protein [Mycobacterium hackensackense]
MTNDGVPEVIDSETSALRSLLIAQYGPELDFIGLAAIGLTRLAWRSDEHGLIEEAHHRITDGEMFAANVATTRLFRQHLESYPHVNWQLLANEVTQEERLAAGRTLADLLGKTRYRRWARWASKFIAAIERVIEHDSPESVLVGLAVAGKAYDRWWSGPQWPLVVDTFIAQITSVPPQVSTSELRADLLTAPDLIAPSVLEWCVDVQQIGATQMPD